MKTKPVVGMYQTYPDKTKKRIAEGGNRINGIIKNSKPEEPLVTIITVCLNSDKTLEQCIQSVIKQTYKNIEYIIIDGLSTDGTLNLIQNYKSVIDYFVSEPDRGLYHAMNKGLKLANGDYILILNSDDWYTKTCVEELVKAKIYSGASFVAALAQYVDQAGNPLHIVRHMPYDASLRLRMPLRHETMLISAAIYNDIGLYNEEYRIIADLHLTIRLFEAGYTLYELQKPLLHFRNDGLSNIDRTGLFKERLKLIRERFPFLKEDEADIFSELSILSPNQIYSLVKNYPQQIELIDSLKLYFKDRKNIDAKWRGSKFEFPEPIVQSPLISIVLPVFNAEKTIRKCIDSILAQTLKDFELIIINDVSTDQSQKIIENYAGIDSRVVALVNEKNIGHGATRNRGVHFAKGSYVFHVDPDDTIPPKALDALYSNAVKFNSDMVKGAYLREQLIHGKQTQKTERKSLISNSEIIINTSLKKMRQLLNTTEGHWSYLYKIDLARKVLYPTDLKMGQDSIFIVSVLVRAKKISIIDEVVYNYCANPLSAMNTFTFRKFVDALEWRRRAWHILNNAGFKEIGIRLLQSYWSDDFFKSLVRSVSNDQLIIFFDKFRTAFKESNLLSGSSDSSSLLSKLFKLIIEKQDQRARKLLLDVSLDIRKGVKFSESSKSLKVATFNSLDFGGAGSGTQRRVKALREQGVDAKIYALIVKSKHEYVEQIKPRSLLRDIPKQVNVWKEIEKLAVLNKNNTQFYCASEIFTLTHSILDFREVQHVVNNSDIIHLHWVVGMLDYEHFSEVVKNKPVVWTLADMNAFTGGCHYSEGCDEYKNKCKVCPMLGKKSNVAHKTWKIKNKLYNKLNNLHIICPSKWLADCAKKSSLLGNKAIYVIPNPLPVDKFTYTNKMIARMSLGLPINRKFILFGADDLTNFRKGGDLMKKMVSHLIRDQNKLNIEAIFFGRSKLDIGLISHSFGHVSDEKYLSLIYSAADVFVFPSREDNSPLTVGESLLCGTPVVSFAVGNIPDLVQHKKTGYIADYLDVKSLADGVLWALDYSDETVCSKRASQCRSSIKKIHNPVLSAMRHIKLYKKILDKKPTNNMTHCVENHNRVFIVTPCLNVVNTIDETIKSVISQSGDFSIFYLIQDGGSNDGTLEVLKHWEDILSKKNPPINCQSVNFVWNSETDAGMYDAICKGFGKLNIEDNEFMTWINGDDILLPDAINKIIQVANNQAAVEWVGSHTHNITNNGVINASSPNPTPTIIIRQGLCDGAKLHWPHLQQEGTFFKKILWDKSKKVLKKYKLAGDWALWREFSRHSEYFQFNKPLAAFRIRPGQMSAQLRDKYDEEISLNCPMENRDVLYQQLYKIRRILHANVIRISLTGEVKIDKETQYVRDYFFKKGSSPIHNNITL